MSECVHGCDGVWIQAGDGLMPCPRCQLEAHGRWVTEAAAAERRRARVDTTARPTPTPEVHEARARIWSTIPRPATKER